MKKITLFSPATIANISCGFDVLGLALDTVGDRITLQVGEGDFVRISEIKGFDLPKDPEKNVAGVAAKHMLGALGKKLGLDIAIEKGIKPGSGIGSSAASAAGVVWGINQLLGNPLEANELIPFAMEAEKLASGEATADNVAAAILGGITLVRNQEPLDVINLHVPSELYVTVIHPHIEIRTEDARKVLSSGISLRQGIQQWANVGAFVAGLYREDYQLISRSLEDVIVEPQRAHLLPRFHEFKAIIQQGEALGGGISGSGPSMFCLCKGRTNALAIATSIESVFKTSDFGYDLYTSKVNQKGCRIIQVS